MKTIASSQSMTVLMFLVAACGGSSSLGGGEESGGAGGSGGTCVSCTGGTGGSSQGTGGSNQGTGGSATGGTGGKGTGGTATGGSAGKGTGGTATGGTGGSSGGGTGGSGTGGSTTGGTGGSGTGGSAGSPPACVGNIAFADPEIEKYVAGLVGKQPPLSGADVAAIDGFYYKWTESTPLTSLRGLQCLKSLQRLSVSGPDVRTFGFLDLTALSDLPNLSDVALTAVRASDYGAPLANLDLAPLSRNQAITILSITSASLADIALLANFANLSTVSLHSDRVTDLSALEHLPIKRANVTGTGITDITPLATALRANEGLSLTAIRTSIRNWAPVTTIPSLTMFAANANTVLDMAPFAILPNVTNLGMKDTGVSQIVVGPSVTILDLADNPAITSYEPLLHANVRNLFVRGNNITDFAPFVAITSYDGGGILDIRANPLDCTAAVPGIQALRARGVKVLQDCIPD